MVGRDDAGFWIRDCGCRSSYDETYVVMFDVVAVMDDGDVCIVRKK